MSTQPKSEAEELLEWLEDRHPDELAQYRFDRYDDGTYFLHADDEEIMGDSLLECLRKAKAFLKPSQCPRKR